MKKMMAVERQELSDVYKAAGAIRAVSELLRKAVCCDIQYCYFDGAFDAIDFIVNSLTHSLDCAITEEGDGGD